MDVLPTLETSGLFLLGTCFFQSAKIDCVLADKVSSHGHENHNVVSFLRSVHSLIERLIYFLSGHSVKTVSF